jgi:hypothetical protein
MPHQLAVRSGVIQPKYPAAPRQWVSYMGDQPQPSGALPTPNLNTGIRRDFSRGWGGDSESKFPRLDATARAFTLGAIGKVLSQGLQGGDESGDTADTPTPPGLPPAPGSPPAPSSGSTSTPGTNVAPYKPRKLYGFETLVDDDYDEPAGELSAGPLGLPSGPLGLPEGRRGLPPGFKGELASGDRDGSPLRSGPGELPPTSRSTDESEGMPIIPDMVYPEGVRPPSRGETQRVGGPTTGPSFAAPALTRQQQSLNASAPSRSKSSGRRARGMSPESRERISADIKEVRDTIARFEGYQ